MSEKRLAPHSGGDADPSAKASTYTFSISVTRLGPGLAPSVSLLEYAKVMRARDLALLAGALLLFLLEPVALFWAFTRVPIRAASDELSPPPRAQARAEPAPREGEAGAGEDVITPLNVRDPASLILAPAADGPKGR